MAVQIYPMNTGFIRLDKGVYITGGQGYGEEVEVPTWAFYVTDGKEKILVDTGMSHTEEANIHHPGSYQPEGFTIDARLKELGVHPKEIDTVIFTHLHWDHCANINLFENARYYVHKKELEFALDPHILYYKSYSSRKIGLTPLFENTRFETVEGEYEYNDYLTIFPTPGHCPGHQSVAVKTSNGLHVIAGDAVFADENMLPDTHRNLPFTPMGRFVNIFELYDSMEQIIGRADHVLTTHGNKVGDQSVYP
jgi:N-acyl homoserine lactone hydrolase